MIEVENNKYELIKDYKNGFNEEEFITRYTDYYKDYDYIVGDIAYSKLRLKGFNNKKKANSINNYKDLNKYLNENCEKDCKYFILKKVIN